MTWAVRSKEYHICGCLTNLTTNITCIWVPRHFRLFQAPTNALHTWGNTVKLIWGPPGTGKTKPHGIVIHLPSPRWIAEHDDLLPTNIAFSWWQHLMSLVMLSFTYDTYGLGDIVLFGNGERMKIDDHEVLYQVFFLVPGFTRLKTCIHSNHFLGQYNLYIQRAKCESSSNCYSKVDDKGTEKKRSRRKELVWILKDNNRSSSF
ncbi:hypothetical protein Leryth_013852 [Lithospermum erythrorhizon]|nr:hypothetical protein Leryth_013852 [Lithospermum erythrorhizon]